MWRGSYNIPKCISYQEFDFDDKNHYLENEK